MRQSVFLGLILCAADRCTLKLFTQVRLLVWDPSAEEFLGGGRYQPLYSFFNADTIIDFLFSIGMRPFVELSFMPEMLTSGSTTVFSYRANVTPPTDYSQGGLSLKR